MKMQLDKRNGVTSGGNGKDVADNNNGDSGHDCQEYYFDFEAYASHLQEHGKFLVTEHGIFELPE